MALLLFALPLWAQGKAASEVTINHDVLNSLGLPAAAGRAGQAATKLRPPPGQPPRSRLLVQPVRQAARQPAAEAPPAQSQSAGQQATTSAPTATAKIDSPAATVVSEPAPLAETTAAPSPAAPAVPPPPEPAESPSSDTLAIVPPPPPPPPLEPPAGAAPEPAAIAGAPDPAADQAGRQQVAARPAAAPLQLRFEAGSAELSDRARSRLTAVTELLLGDDAQRVQLHAYAQGSEGQANAARRLSLSRARAVRAFLAERGVATSRIDVRALGTKFGDGPPDRVDVVYARR